MEILIYSFEPRNIYSWLIRGGTGDKYVHSAIGYYDSTIDKYIVYEAVNKGFCKSSYTKEQLGNCAIYGVQTAISQTKVSALLDSMIGKGYDWMSIILIGLNLILPTNFMLKYDNPKKLICSEAVAVALRDLGILDLTKILNKSVEYITPQDLFDTLPDYISNINTY